jgi:hypothetical protein
VLCAILSNIPRLTAGAITQRWLAKGVDGLKIKDYKINNNQRTNKMAQYIKNGKTYLTTQDPYIEGSGDEAYYTAQAFDDNNQEYKLIWEIIDGRKDWEDESERCNWDVFRVIPL